MTSAEFFDWWRARLAELVPASLSGSWHNAKTTIVLDIRGKKIELSAPPSQDRAIVDLPAEIENTPPAEATAFLSSLRGTAQRIRISLPPEEYLLRHLTLPRAARAHLAEAVGYQLPQLTPFRTDQLLYSCGETADSPSEGPISVWLAAIPRQRIERALKLIGQTPPAGPLPLRAPPEPERPLVVSWPVADSSSQPRRRMRLAWVGLIVLWAAVVGLHFQHRQQMQQDLDQTRNELRARGSEVAQLGDRIDRIRSQAAWLAQHRQHAVSPLLLFDVLTQQLDDQTWLQGLDLRGNRLTLRGVSSSPATLLETLEASELLRDVRFEAAITRDGRVQGDRFNISARLENTTRDGDT